MVAVKNGRRLPYHDPMVNGPDSHAPSQKTAADSPPPPSSPFAELPPTGDRLFDDAVRGVLHQEGFFSNDPDDPGGITVWGISLRFARRIGDMNPDTIPDLDLNGDGKIDAIDIRLMTPQSAVKIYKEVFWDPYPYGRLPGVVSAKVFSLAVNTGPHQAHILLQRACRACSDDRLIEDGILGLNTLRVAKGCYQPALLAALRSEAAGFYRLVAKKNPKSRKYLNGWLNRAYS